MESPKSSGIRAQARSTRSIALCEEITGNEFAYEYVEENRRGDHIRRISDLRRFQAHYLEWEITIDVPRIMTEIYESNIERWREICVS